MARLLQAEFMCEVVACQDSPVYFKCIGPANLKLLLAVLVSPVLLRLLWWLL